MRDGGPLIAAPFSDPPFFVTGLPTSKAYWARAAIGGVVRDVLVQVFERRVLTYVPTNGPAFRVEMANIGLHYRAWRYGTSLDYFGALAGNRWTYADSRTSGMLTYQVVGLDSAFKPGQTLLRVVVASAVPTTEYWQGRDGQLLIHGRTEPNGATVRYAPPYIAARYCLAVGQRWETTTRAADPRSRPQVERFSYTVERTETVVTPPRIYPSFRIQREDTDTPEGGACATTL